MYNWKLNLSNIAEVFVSLSGELLPINERQMVSSNGSLIIRKISRRDQGQYKCLAENRQGQIHDRSIDIKVLGKYSFLDYNNILDNTVDLR